MKYAYWGVTVLLALAFIGGGIADITLAEDIRQAMTHLGYPLYFAVLLGVWKLLGAVAILAPGTARIKEWAYAGLVFDLTGAVISHLAVGDSILEALPPIVLLGLTVASYLLRPKNRRLPSAIAPKTSAA